MQQDQGGEVMMLCQGSRTQKPPLHIWFHVFYVISHTRPCAMGSPGLTTGLRGVYFGLGVQNRDITHHPPHRLLE